MKDRMAEKALLLGAIVETVNDKEKKNNKPEYEAISEEKKSELEKLVSYVKTVKIDLAYGQYRPPGGSHPAQP